MDRVEQIFGGGASAEAQVEDMRNEADALDASAVTAAKDAAATPMTSLASWVMARFKENEDARRVSGMSARLDYFQRANRCEFSDEQKDVLERVFGAEIVKRIFVPITSTKVRAARSLMIDLAHQSGDPLFRIEPTPVPELPAEISAAAVNAVSTDIANLFSSLEAQGVTSLPPEAMAKVQQLVASVTEDTYDAVSNKCDAAAKIRAERMQKKVWDTMLEGGFKEAFEGYVDSVCTFGTGVVIGPVVKNVAKNECVFEKRTKVSKYRRKVRAIPCYESVSPQDCYPAPNAVRVSDGPLCITVKYAGDELWRLSGNAGDGWIGDAVRLLLARHPRGGVKLSVATYDPDRNVCENNGFNETSDGHFEGVRCFASVRGSDLLGMGISKAPRGIRIVPEDFYKTETVVIDNRVVYCRIYPDELDLPVSKGVFYTLPGSWWGESIADKVAMSQTVLNNVIKALLQNMAVASGPIFWINDVQRMANKSPDALKLKAGMTIPFLTSMAGNTGAPIGAISVPSNASELLSVWSAMQQQADADSGVPRYAEGQSAGQSGALRTSGGLAQFTEHMMRGMKMVMSTTDANMISPVARMTADWILLNDDDMSLKGDVTVVPVGLVGKVMKVQRDQARLQLLQLVLNSQLMTSAIGVKGVMEMFRPSLTDTDLNPDDIVPSKVRMEALEQIEGIKQIFEATSASAGVQENAGMVPQEGGGAPGIERVQSPVQGGVAERRGMA